MPAEQPFVSIVIPSFNHARYLAAAIDSVLAQDYPRVELIVIDDGSTDDSAAVLEKYRGRFYWEVQRNQGQAATMNRGWRMSRGEILAYLSADDALLPHAVSASVSCLGRNPDAVLCYCDFNLIDPDSAFLRRVRAPQFDYRRMVTEILCPPGPGAFFRRAALESAGEWNGAFRQFGDYEFWLRLGLQGRFVHLPEVLALFRVHPGSQSFTHSPGRPTDEAVKILESYFANPRVPAELLALRERAFSAAWLQTARLDIRSGEYRRGLRAARRAFTLHPPNLFAWRTLRLAANALVNRLGHRLLWSARGVLRRRG
jgi:glycosyltransferase involved in cell wall biosynthesis